MAPPIPTLTQHQLTAHLSTITNPSNTSPCPLKQLTQYDCTMRSALPLSSSSMSSGSVSSSSSSGKGSGKDSGKDTGRPRLVCTEFTRYFRRCTALTTAAAAAATSTAGDAGSGLGLGLGGVLGQKGIGGGRGIDVNVEVTSLMGFVRPVSRVGVLE